ncbi:DUF3693 domain-containing protein [Streptomyces smyrnaeus]|uniref:DUF3693 domain-containing protein n=1 Tax=Streptomyces smyrnaeus TaxID=1387713 RepID=UPI0036822D7F
MVEPVHEAYEEEEYEEEYSATHSLKLTEEQWGAMSLALRVRAEQAQTPDEQAMWESITNAVEKALTCRTCEYCPEPAVWALEKESGRRMMVSCQEHMETLVQVFRGTWQQSTIVLKYLPMQQESN